MNSNKNANSSRNPIVREHEFKHFHNMEIDSTPSTLPGRRIKISNVTWAFISSFMFISISVIIGVLIVYFTTPKQREKECISTYVPILNQEIQYNSLTRSIAVGDFNSDHHLDIVVANYGSDDIGVLLGKGDGTFASQITYETGELSFPCFVIINDFNDDTVLDIAVANFGTNSLGIFIGKGDGSFMSQITFSTGSSRPLSIAVGDFNNDTRMDIAIASYGTDSIAILLRLDDGNFTSPIKYSTGYDSNPQSLVAADFNNDNVLDIAVANFGTSNIGVFLGYGNGSFESQILYSTGPRSRPYSIATADFDGDNLLDITVANAGEGNVGVFLGYGNGTFASQINFSTGNGSIPHSVMVAYLNNDTFLDIVVANSGTNTVAVLIGYGNGEFANMKTYSTGLASSPQFVTAGDFNNNHRMDIAVANNQSNSVGILLSDRTIDFQEQITCSLDDNSWPYSASVGDFNNDNQLDVVVANSNDDSVGVLLGVGDGIFDDQTTFSTGSGSLPKSVAVGDFNNDNNLDIVVANSNADNIGVLLGFGNGTFDNQTIFSTDSESEPVSVAVGYFNNDNYLDIVVANSRTNNVGVLLGFGNGTFDTQRIFPTGGGSMPMSVAVGDFNNDSHLDIVVANSRAGNIGVLLGFGNGTFESQIIYSTGTLSNPWFVTVGDLNNDFRMDIVVPNRDRDRVGIFLGVGNGSFASQNTYYTGYTSSPSIAVIGDFNNDNLSDIIVSNSNTDYLSVFRGLGNGNFSSLIIYPINSSITQNFITSGDLNKDGQLDIIIANYAGDFIAALLGHDVGAFNSLTGFSTSYALLPSSLTIGDFNRDSRMDMGVSNFASNTLDIYLGYENGAFTMKNTFSTGENSRPWMIVSGDLNNDNISDISVANTGNNNIGVFLGYGNGSFRSIQTYSTGTASQPYSLAIGDLNNDNHSDFVVANFGAHNIGVILGFDTGSFIALHELVLYSSTKQNLQQLATGDFNNDNKPDIVFIELFTNIVGILIASTNGTFASPITYSTGSGSAPCSLAVGDFNNDNQLDIVVANSGTNNIGVFLGYGNGTLANYINYSVSPGTSPYFVVVGDLNNDHHLDIVVANYGTNDIGLLLGYGNGTFASSITYSTGSGSAPYFLVLGDFNNDNKLDIAVANSGTNNIGVFLGYGNGTLTSQIVYSTAPGTSPRSLGVGDFNNDNQLDIVFATYNNGLVGINLGYGNGTFASPLINLIGSGAQITSVSVGDFNNDKQLDIAVVSSYFNAIYVLIGYGNGVFAHLPSFRSDYFYRPLKVIVADFNGDRRQDCAVIDYFQVYVFFGSVNEGYLDITTFSTGPNSSPRSVSVGDVNNDNRLDIVVANSGSENIGVFLGLGYGDFAVQKTFSTGSASEPYSVALGDFNGDHQLDIAVANHGIGSVGIFLGYGNGTFTSQTMYFAGTVSDPYFLAVGDLNNDTRLDIVVTNFRSDYILIFYGAGDGTFVNKTIISMGYSSGPSFAVLSDVNNDHLLDIAVTNNGFGNIEILAEKC